MDREENGTPSRALDVRAALPAVVATPVVGALAALDGGYFPVTWGWSALALLVVTATGVLLVGPIDAGRLDVVLVVGFAALAAWIGLSATWSDSVPRTLLELERAVLYTAGVAALVVLATRDSAVWLGAAVWAVATAIAAYSLATHYVGDGADDRLSGPLGYWNALAVLCVLGALLAVGLVLHRGSRMLRVAAGASLAVLLATLGLTASRGAAIALGTGAVVSVALRASARGVERRTAIAAVLTLVAVAAGFAVLAGGPAALAGRVSDSFRGEAPARGVALQDRLLSVSGSGRDLYWRVAWDQYRENPALGSGAGTYELYWYRDRSTIYGARDAHNLYFETLAELGPVGLALLVFAFGVPLVAAARSRARPLVPALAGAYAAFLVHAALDWDWELPALTLAALACGVALVSTTRSVGTRVLRSRERVAAVALVVPIAAFVAVSHAANGAVAESDDAYVRGHHAEARADARRGERWAPWASAPLRARAEAELALGNESAARASLLEALDRDPRDWWLWYLLGTASSGHERTRAVEQASRLNPLSPAVRALAARS